MTKKRGRERHRNPEPFLAEDDGSVASNKRTKNSKKARKHQENLILSSGMSSKILKEAQIQQKEIEDEENTNAFIEEQQNDYQLDEEDDDFGAFIEKHRADEANQVMETMMNETKDEDEEKLLERFLSKEDDDAGPQTTLPDIILATIKKKQYDVTSGIYDSYGLFVSNKIVIISCLIIWFFRLLFGALRFYFPYIAWYIICFNPILLGSIFIWKMLYI